MKVVLRRNYLRILIGLDFFSFFLTLGRLDSFNCFLNLGTKLLLGIVVGRAVILKRMNLATVLLNANATFNVVGGILCE